MYSSRNRIISQMWLGEKSVNNYTIIKKLAILMKYALLHFYYSCSLSEKLSIWKRRKSGNMPCLFWGILCRLSESVDRKKEKEC